MGTNACVLMAPVVLNLVVLLVLGDASLRPAAAADHATNSTSSAGRC